MIQTAICLLAVVPVRKEPSHRSEMVSQLLFGEYVSTGEEKDDFIHAKGLYDGYEGWVQAAQITPVPNDQILSTNRYISAFGAAVAVNGSHQNVPFTVPVYSAEKTDDSLRFGNKEVLYYVSERVWNSDEKAFTKESLNQLIQAFLGTPYLWAVSRFTELIAAVLFNKYLNFLA